MCKKVQVSPVNYLVGRLRKVRGTSQESGIWWKYLGMVCTYAIMR